MVNYSLGKIYKIVSDLTDKIYIGSTCLEKLCMRLSKHKYNYNEWLNTNKHYYTSYELIKLGDVKIILIENYSCNNRDELRARERYYIELYKNICVNKVIPYRTENEHLKVNKEYRDKNKEQIKIQRKQYRDNNIEKIREKKLLKMTCECGLEINKNHRTRHIKTLKHIALLKKL